MTKNSIKKEARRILEHGDPLAYMMNTAKKIEPRLNENIFKMMLLLSVAERCSANCSDEGKEELARLRLEYPVENTVLNHLSID